MKLAGLIVLAGLLCACARNATVRGGSPYDRAFDAVMTNYDLPGLALGVIENGEVTYLRTAGELVAGSGKEITPNTLFKVASNSKAMTASVLARQVDAGKLRWEDPVVRYLPQFRMYDPWVTQNMQVRDLLVHNSGLPEGGGDLMLWPEPNAFTRNDIVNGLAHIRPAYGFRSGYAYDNLLYVVAGEVAAAVGGRSYEELVRSQVFKPLGLGCRVGEWRKSSVPDAAQPHLMIDGRNVVVRADEEVVPRITSAAAGGIRCSLNDMLAWAQNWLAPDPRQMQWLSEGARQAMWTPRTPMPISDRTRRWNDTHYYAYAFGFRAADVNGVWTISHTGTLMGMYSVMYLLPDQKSGFVMLTNGEGANARTVMTEALLEQMTRTASARSADFFIAEIAAEPAATAKSLLPDTSSRVPVKPDRMRAQTGTWRDPWFGEVLVCAHHDTVRFSASKSPLLTGTVMRVGSRYLVDWLDGSVDAEAWLDFAGGNAGHVTDLAMAKVDPDADFSFDYEDLAFRRTGPCP